MQLGLAASTPKVLGHRLQVDQVSEVTAAWTIVADLFALLAGLRRQPSSPPLATVLFPKSPS
jgi:hypothetical protein